jgi:hypothetical protein
MESKLCSHVHVSMQEIKELGQMALTYITLRSYEYKENPMDLNIKFGFANI